MTLAKHTPGPWVIAGDGSQLTYIAAPDGANIARLHPDWLTSRNPDEVFANALVMKAAPELLEALTALCDEIDEGGKQPDIAYIKAFIVSKCRAAIAKATGEKQGE